MFPLICIFNFFPPLLLNLLGGGYWLTKLHRFQVPSATTDQRHDVFTTSSAAFPLPFRWQELKRMASPREIIPWLAFNQSPISLGAFPRQRSLRWHLGKQTKTTGVRQVFLWAGRGDGGEGMDIGWTMSAHRASCLRSPDFVGEMGRGCRESSTGPRSTCSPGATSKGMGSDLPASASGGSKAGAPGWRSWPGAGVGCRRPRNPRKNSYSLGGLGTGLTVARTLPWGLFSHLSQNHAGYRHQRGRTA